VATREAPTAEASAIPGAASDGISIAAPMAKAAAFAACPDGEGRATGNSPQPASDGNVGVRAAPARQALADDVASRAGRRDAAQAAPGGPPGLPVASGPQRGGQQYPEETVVSQT